MSHLLWKYYSEDDLDRFRRLLATASHNTQHTPKGHAVGTGQAHSYGSLVGSPGGFGASPKVVVKNRKVSGQVGHASGTKGPNLVLSRADVNSRDHAGLTILMRASASTSQNAISFALALIEHPLIDLYLQDPESGWTALHRALYFGNVTVGRAIIKRDRQDPNGFGSTTASRAGTSVIKIKDHEGNSPFDVYNATIARRVLPREMEEDGLDDSSEDEDDSMPDEPAVTANPEKMSVNGDEIFFWGSSKNHSLGFGDGDDRQHPEKLTLKRPDHLLFRFYREYLESTQSSAAHPENYFSQSVPKSLNELPNLILNRSIMVQDIVLAKLHSAILTTDPEANLYICGFGPGGRLGTGDEVTRFTFTCIEGGGLAGKKVITVALGQNHTLAVSSGGEIFAWGNNAYGQLGYSLPPPAMKDEEPFCSTPRQLFGSLKREKIVGVAASALHSVAHTSTALFTWGKNEGQLGLMDSDSRSLDVQAIPRRVAASLFKAPILSVSAINGATICLLLNHTVCVFTNYGYNIVKFPLQEGFSNYHLRKSRFTTYDGAMNHISSITAGGDTIAAISSRGDLFTINVRKVESNPASTSTTNPSKIKGALSQPQRVWSLRKGNWDGIKSVGVSENGSVIVCTQAGAVWQRVKRAKIKDTYTAAGDFNRKDFKFQRIPGLTKVAAVRSTAFGVYAAIRKDCDVTRNQILVKEQELWQDVSPLLSLKDLEASEPLEEENTSSPRFWTPALPKNLFDPIKRAVLASPDIEADVSSHLLGMDLRMYDMELCTTTSNVCIPVHGFILAARSKMLRSSLKEFRRAGSWSSPDVFSIEYGASQSPRSSQLPVRLIFHGLDFLAIVNLAVFFYTDTVVDVWQFTRQCPKMAFRYRQVRIELMKAAGYLQMGNLEYAVRLMTDSERRLNVDMASAIQDPAYFEDGDIILELDGSEVLAHSSILCQRCPFFQGLYNGRAGGQWLAGRRQEDSKEIRIDLKHIAPETFELVLRYLYADIGTELFDDVVSPDIDEFSELVMDVMSVANELMLDRLSQICQEVIGRFVNTRNISQLLNSIAPCSVTEFKNTGLEYICLQLECMLENHLIDDLDEDLLLELDEVVRSNQLNCLPFTKSGRFESELHERHPSLAGDIDEERQRRVRDMTFRANLRDDDSRPSSSFRQRVGSLDDLLPYSPSQEKARKKSQAARNAPFSPSIRPKESTADLMFDMDDDDTLSPGSPKSPAIKSTSDLAGLLELKATWDDVDPEGCLVDLSSSLPPSVPKPGAVLSIHDGGVTPPSASVTKTWSSPALPSAKLDLNEIMAQASSSRTSNLSIGLSAQKVTDSNAKAEVLSKVSAPKLSQKERKKQQHKQALQHSMARSQNTSDQTDIKPSSPWQVATTGSKTLLKEVLNEPKAPMLLAPKAMVAPIPMKPLTPRRTASPDTRFAGQSRSNSSSNIAATQQSSAGPSRPSYQQQQGRSSPLVPHSKSYTAPAVKAEPSLQLSMADIIGQQRREQEVIKEAVAKKSLQEIQEEQAFQEWWDQESRRAQEEEAAKAKIPSGPGRSGKSGGGRGNDRGRGGRGRGVSSRRGARGRGKENTTVEF